jgi:hypothetical protein
MRSATLLCNRNKSNVEVANAAPLMPQLLREARVVPDLNIVFPLDLPKVNGSLRHVDAGLGVAHVNGGRDILAVKRHGANGGECVDLVGMQVDVANIGGLDGEQIAAGRGACGVFEADADDEGRLRAGVEDLEALIELLCALKRRHVVVPSPDLEIMGFGPHQEAEVLAPFDGLVFGVEDQMLDGSIFELIGCATKVLFGKEFHVFG